VRLISDKVVIIISIIRPTIRHLGLLIIWHANSVGPYTKWPLKVSHYQIIKILC